MANLLGEAYVLVRPKTTGFATALRQQLANIGPINVPVRVTKTAMRDALKVAADGQFVTVKARIDRNHLRQQLGNANATIPVNIKFNAAQLFTAAAALRNNPIRVPANVYFRRSQINQALQAAISGVSVPVGTNVNNTIQQQINRRRYTSQVDVIVNDIVRSSRGIRPLTATVAGLGPAAIPLGAAGLAGIGGAATLGLGGMTGLGVMAGGFQGIGESLKALRDVRKNAAKDARAAAEAETEAANAVLAAQARVAQAVRSVASTRRNANEALIRAQERVVDSQRNVTRSERNLLNAQRDAARAQEALNDAREDAKRRIEDMGLALRDGALDEREALKRVKEAREALSTSSGEQGDDPALEYERALLTLDEVRARNKRLAEEKARLDSQGVEGTDEVRAAVERVADANERVRDSEEAVAEANRDVARAVREQKEAQADASDAIANALASAAEAQRALNEAQREAAVVSETSAQKYADSLAGLTPAGRSFVMFLDAEMVPALMRLRNASQSNMLPGVEQGLKSALSQLPLFESITGNAARGIGTAFARFGTDLNNPRFTAFFTSMSENIEADMTGLGAVMSNVAEGFAGIYVAFRPFATEMREWLVDVTGRFAEWGSTLGTNQKFIDFMEYVKNNLPLIRDTLSAVFDALVHVAIALAPYGETILGLIRDFSIWVSGLDPETIRQFMVPILATIAVVKVLGVALGFLIPVIRAVMIVGGGFLKFLALLRIALLANPIGVVVGALALLAFGFMHAWQSSEKFRDIVKTVFEFLKDAIFTALQFITNLFYDFAIGFLKIADTAFGWIPGVKDKTDGAIKALENFKDQANANLQAIKDKELFVKVHTDGDWSFTKAQDQFVTEMRSRNEKVPGRDKRLMLSSGGPVWGAGGPTDDAIPAMLSNGEFVIRADSVKKIGVDNLRHLNEKGEIPHQPHFASGGLVMNLKGKADEVLHHAKTGIKTVVPLAIDEIVKEARKAASNKPLPPASNGRGLSVTAQPLGVQRMMEILRGPFPGLPLNSGYRPGSRTRASGRLSYHALGRAVDVPPRMDVFNWIAENYPQATELIFSPAGGRQISRGRPYFYKGVTRDDHWDHIHWAMKNGGLAGRDGKKVSLYDSGGVMRHGDIGVNASGEPEAVLTNEQWQTLRNVANVMGQNITVKIGDTELKGMVRTEIRDAAGNLVTESRAY